MDIEVVSFVISVIAIVLSFASLIVAIINCVIENKPFVKRISVYETLPEKENLYGICLANTGRDTVFIDRVELRNNKTKTDLGMKAFMQEDGFVCVLKPGEVRVLDIELFCENPHQEYIDPNNYLEIVIYEKNGNRTRKRKQRNLFGVG